MDILEMFDSITVRVTRRWYGVLYDSHPFPSCTFIGKDKEVMFNAVLEIACSELGARMSAMDSSSRNAGEMLDRLTVTYNRTRQASITTELIEIISGASALTGESYCSSTLF